LAELQKDPMTRGDFLGFGLLGAVVGAVLTIPPTAFVLSPIIKTNILGETDVSEGWQEVGPVSEVPEDKPVAFEVEFPINQSYGTRSVQEESGVTGKRFTVKNAVWLSWKHKVVKEGRQGGIYDINGGWVGGPPPRGMYRYTKVKVEEDGKLYVKHEFDIGGEKGPQRPYVI
jgi:hypothetical protein